jgi:hypothetical protein
MWVLEFELLKAMYHAFLLLENRETECRIVGVVTELVFKHVQFFKHERSLTIVYFQTCSESPTADFVLRFTAHFVMEHCLRFVRDL